MTPLKCCVGGCDSTSETHRLFSVPKDDELRKLWIDFIVPTNPLLIGLSKEQLLRKRVCHKHFERCQLDGQGRRTRYSYPSLFTAKEIAHGVPLSSKEYNVLSEHNYHQLPLDNNNDDSTDTPLVIVTIDDNERLCEHSYASGSSAISSCYDETVTSRIPIQKHKDDGVHLSIPSCSYNETNTKMDTTETLQKGLDDGAHLSIPLCSYNETNTKMDTTETLQKGLDDGAHLSIPSCSYNETNTKMDTIETLQKGLATPLPKKLGPVRKFIREARTKCRESLDKTALQRITDAQTLSKHPDFFKNFDALNKQAKTLLTMQLKLVAKSKMARRFNMEEKLIALTLMKQSPKGYKLLEKMFALPSKRTLNRLASKICFEAGINCQVVKYLQNVTKTWDRNRKLCTICFDEVALSPHLTFNENKDTIDGFVELGQGRKMKYCDHALVFMIRGIFSSWRQSIAYYFCEGTVSATELMHILKDVVSQVADTGLQPLGLVCDQGSTFRSALRLIRNDTIRSRNSRGIRDDGTVELAGHSLSIFYDPPHLLKSIRNNFLTKDIIFDGKIGSWRDIMFIYDIDSRLGHTRALPKLTAHHVVPNKIKKMKVSAATQVLSARTAAMLRYTNALNIHNSMAPVESHCTTMATTADAVEFFDTLFDSVNGSPGASKRGKLRNAVKENSRHMEFWQEALKKFREMKFQDRSSKAAIQAGQPRLVRVPCLDGWMTTLESFVRITKLLLSEYGVEYYYPRFINQDPLENFFGRIRAINYRNINPDAHTFIYSFKTLILSNLLIPHSRFSNCEEDGGETLIQLSYLFENKQSNKENTSEITSRSHDIPLPSSSEVSDEDIRTQVLMEKINVHCSAYTAGYISRKISNYIKCNMCTQTYTCNNVGDIHKYIQYREYKSLKKRNLAYPNENFLRLYREVAESVHTYLNMHGHKKNVAKTVTNMLHQNLQLSWLGCKKHHNDVIKKFLSLTIRLQVHNWCKIINKIFKGDIEEKYVRRMKEPQKMAYKKFETVKLKKKCINRIKNL